jgi:hypothetical protein
MSCVGINIFIKKSSKKTKVFPAYVHNYYNINVNNIINIINY